MKRRFFALVVCLVIVFSLATSAFAAESIPAWGDFPVADHGDSGYRVRAIQTILLGNSLYTYNAISGAGGADGSFGDGTENAVIYFQQHESLNDDGVVGRRTWLALSKNVSLAPGSSQEYRTKINYVTGVYRTLFRFTSGTTWQFRRSETNSWHTISS